MAAYNYRPSPSDPTPFYYEYEEELYYDEYEEDLIETVDVSSRMPTIEEARQQYQLALYGLPVSEGSSMSYDNYDPEYHDPQDKQQTHMLIILVLTLVTMVALLVGAYWLLVQQDVFGRASDPVITVVDTPRDTSQSYAAANTVQYSGLISPVFSKEVQYWGEQIVRWSAQQGVDPDAIATIMQIESCGHPGAESWAGAQGLFQVMPFHFIDGENMTDPDTNAFRGVAYFAERLVQTEGDVGRAFAGYNGGHGASGSSWDYWAQETKDYYVWSTGIYDEAKSGAESSETLERWMSYGGESLCQSAATILGIQ